MMLIEKKIQWLLLCFVITITILWGTYWLAIAAYYSVPNVEDFSLAIRPRDQGIIPSIINLLVSYDSRYTANILQAINPLAFNWIQGFVLMPIICFILFAGTFYYFISSLIDVKGIRLALVAFALLFVIIHYALEPSLSNGLFLMVSTFTYIYPWIFLFVWLSALLHTLQEQNERKKIGLSIIGYTALILSFGCSEFFISINSFILLTLFIATFFYSQSNLKYVFGYGIVALSALLFIFFCPSGKMNSEKILNNLDSRYPNSNFIIESLKIYIFFLRYYVFHPLAICFILLTTILFKRIQIAKRLYFNISHKFLFFIIIFTISLGYITSWIFFVPLGQSNIFPKYVFVSLLVLPQLGLFVYLPIYLLKKVPLKGFGKYFTFAESGVACLFFLVLLYSDNNLGLIKKEFKAGIIQDVKRKAEQFYSQVAAVQKKTSTHSVVYFENPAIIPKSNYFGPDMMANRGAPYWNIAYEDYFKVDEVRMRGDTIFK